MTKETDTGKTVLLIDDDPIISQAIVDILKRADFTVEYESSSKKAMTRTREVHPDVIILDLMMTAPTGEELLSQFKRDEDLKGIPVLVFSNKGIEQDMGYLEKDGAAKVLVKADTRMEKLVEVVGELAGV